MLLSLLEKGRSQFCLDFQYLFFMGSIERLTVASKAIHGSGQVSFWPNPDSTHQRRVKGRSNPKPTVGKIGRFGFLWWLALVGLDRLPKLKKASKSEKKASPESRIFARNWKFSLESGKFRRKLKNSCRKLDFFWNMHFFFLLEIVGFGRIWLNPTRYSRIWSRSLLIWLRSRRIWLVFAGFSQIFL